MSLDRKDSYQPTLAAARPGGATPDLRLLQQEIQKVWRAIHKLEGRVDPGTELLSNLSVAGDLTVEGESNFPGGVVGPVEVTGGVSATGDLTVGGNLSVAGTSQLTGTTTQTASLTLMDLLAQFGMAAPAVSAAGSGRIYFDSGSSVFKVSENGGAYGNLVPAASVSYFRLLSVNVTPVGNAAATLSDLMSFSVPGGTLATDGQFLLTLAFGTYAANVNNKDCRQLFGATNIVLNQTGSGGAGAWFQIALVARTGATTQTSVGQIADREGGIGDNVVIAATPGETLSGAVTVKVQGGGAAAAANDVVQNFYAVAKISLT